MNSIKQFGIHNIVLLALTIGTTAFLVSPFSAAVLTATCTGLAIGQFEVLNRTKGILSGGAAFAIALFGLFVAPATVSPGLHAAAEVLLAFGVGLLVQRVLYGADANKTT